MDIYILGVSIIPMVELNGMVQKVVTLQVSKCNLLVVYVVYVALTFSLVQPHRKVVLNMKTIKNRAEVIEQLTDMLMQYDKDLRDYQVDIYLYYDKDSQTAELDTFTSVGGNFMA